MIARSMLAALALTLASAAPAGSPPGFFSDPVVTYTNGMRLASSTSLRSHNVYYRCDPGHVGYCDGCLHSPCRNDIRSLGTRCHGKYVPPYTPMGATSPKTVHAMDGVEPASSVSLGTLTASSENGPGVTPLGRTEPAALGGLGPALPTSVAPSDQAAGGVWLDAIQTIGRKMMTAPEG